MDILKRMRQAIHQQKYRISSHANDEMADDFLMAADIENIILTGEIFRQLSDDPRGIRYEIAGETVDNRQAFAVCRFLTSGVLLIITAYTQELDAI